MKIIKFVITGPRHLFLYPKKSKTVRFIIIKVNFSQAFQKTMAPKMGIWPKTQSRPRQGCSQRIVVSIVPEFYLY